MLRERAARVTERQSRCAWQRGGVDEYYPATAMINSLSVSSGRQDPALANAPTAVGRPSHQVAVITRRPTGYFIADVEGEMFPSVNGASLGSAAHPLKDKDLIELAGVKMEFSNPGSQG